MGKKISLKVVLPEEPLSICKCDSARISQVLGILLDNGASYVSVGGRMEMGVKENEKDHCHSSGADTLPGICRMR